MKDFQDWPWWVQTLIYRNRLVKHRVDSLDGGSGYCGRNFPLIQRCIHCIEASGSN